MITTTNLSAGPGEAHLTHHVANHPPDWLTTFPQRMYAVTPEQVTQAAKTQLDPSRMSIVVVGDLATVKPQLEAVPALRDAVQRAK